MMKYILTIACTFALLQIQAQTLENTEWKTYLSMIPDTVSVIANTDTFYVNASDGSNMVTAWYEEMNDTMVIRDLSGPFACANPDTGLYRFSIVDDTLTFALLEDSCATRVISLDGTKLWRVNLPTGTQENVALTAEIGIYPNPSTGVFNIEIESTIEDKVDVEILDIMGQVIDQRTLVIRAGKQQIPLNLNLTSGQYFVKIKGTQLIAVARFIVE